MTTGTTSLLGRLSGGVSIALLALGMTFGASLARADEAEAPAAPSPQAMMVAPIVDAVDAMAQRLSHIEEAMALFAGSFESQRVATRQLCVSDDSGAETCITKTQLDGLLKRMAQTEISEPPVTVAIVAPAPEPAADSAATTEATDSIVSVADAIVTETTAVPLADAAETAPTTEAIASASDAAQDEPQFTGSTAGKIDGAAIVSEPPVMVAIVAPAPEPTADSTAITAAMDADVSVGDAIVTETTVVPLADAAETAPTTEVIASASDAAQDEQQFTGSTAGEIDGAAIVSEPPVMVAIVAPAPEPTADSTAITAATDADVSVADAIVTETTVVPFADAAETAPTTEAIASASDAAQDEPQFTGSTAGEIDGAALVSYPDVEITVVGGPAAKTKSPPTVNE